jgi:hypothetical protein
LLEANQAADGGKGGNLSELARTPVPVPEPVVASDEATEKAGAGPQKRGTRLPADFKVTREMVEWLRANHPLVDGRLESEKFELYWRSKAGKDATKTDWPATWRRWMITASQEGQRRARPAAAPPSTAPGRIPPAEQCPNPDHRGQRASNCGLCRAERLGKKAES